MTDKARSCNNCAHTKNCQVRIKLAGAIYYGRKIYYLNRMMLYSRIAPIVAEHCDHYEEES